VYNGFNCNARVLNPSLWVGNNDIDPLGSAKFMYTPNFDEDVVNIKLKLDESCNSYLNYDSLNINVTVSKGEVRILYIYIYILLYILLSLLFYLQLFDKLSAHNILG
jgi:hypothetical protein